MRLKELAWIFLRLGATAFGGPAVHIALLEDEIVRRRQWLTHAEFLDLLGATNLIPGPNSTEMAIHIGYRRAGWPGLVVAGACFIIPAFLITLACAWFYTQYREVPRFAGVLYGLKPVVVAVVVQAMARLGRTSLRSTLAWLVALGAMVASLCKGHELLVLLGAGLLAALLRGAASQRQDRVLAFVPPLALPGPGTPAVAAAVTGVGLGPIFWSFAKVGAVLYGGGYVLLAFIRAEFVTRHGWLSESQLLDSIAVGQITPGPLFSTATFVGYLMGGGPGACVATAGIFLPAFVFVALSARYVERLRQSRFAGGFLDGVNAASLGLMGAVTVQLLGAAFVDRLTVAMGIVAAGVLLRFAVHPAWLMLAAGVIGAAAS